MTSDSDLHFIKGVDEKPEQAPNSLNSKWVRIHFIAGTSCLGFYSYAQQTWKEFKDVKNLFHATPINEKLIRGWNY